MNRLRQFWYDLRTGFVFLPALVIVFAAALAIVLTEVDTRLADGAFQSPERVFGAGAEGSRGLLSAIAGSMITVAGTVFSITLVALSLVSSQYTSRVLRTFMRDRLTQLVLGVFVGVFVYALIVLRTIRSDGDEFVPTLSVLVALALAVVAVVFLVYFIHHVAQSIQASYILSRIFAETTHAIDSLFPEDVGEEYDAEVPDVGEDNWQPIPSPKTGYVQSLDAASVLRTSESLDIVLRLDVSIGAFVVEGLPVAAAVSSGHLDDTAIARIARAFAVDRERSIEQDAAFGIRQLVDVAMKALSTGMNDTSTAIICIDYLTAILARLSARRIPSVLRTKDGKLRVIAPGPSYADLVNEAFDQIRRAGSGNVSVLMRLLRSLDTVQQCARSPTRRRVLRDHASAIDEIAGRCIQGPDRETVRARALHVMNTLSKPAPTIGS